MPEFEASLTVNGNLIELTGFPKEFLIKTAIGSVSSLKKVGEIKNVEIALDGGKVSVTVSGEKIPLSPFPMGIIAGTFSGLVSTLKGVDRKVESFKITVKQ